jgi:hypothetical protein
MKESRRVSFDSKISWELGGESVIYCEIEPDPPHAGSDTLVRITHVNLYSPIDDVSFYIRIGDPQNPTAFNDMDSAEDWQKMGLIEEIIIVKDQEMYRSDLQKPLSRRAEVPWYGTFETTLSFPPGEHLIEIKVASDGFMQSGVIASWSVVV